ncbi:hypothetical protein M422DRAFT_248676 [Sphaerobolus stellatus SS14]|nr:hypothetical protein M422DRAFT_248676 [Sphaerobolus stellatus SS14]
MHQGQGTCLYIWSAHHLPISNVGTGASRRNDIECLAYTIMALSDKGVPWMALRENNKIMDMKLSLATSDDQVDAITLSIWRYSRDLGFWDAPDYDLITNIITMK